jgi:hypothetical protein
MKIYLLISSSLFILLLSSCKPLMTVELSRCSKMNCAQQLSNSVILQRKVNKNKTSIPAKVIEKNSKWLFYSSNSFQINKTNLSKLRKAPLHSFIDEGTP